MRRGVILAAVAASVGGAAGPAAAEVESFAVVIGNDAGTAAEPRLRYAESDAAKIAGVIQDVGGFLPENVTVLLGRDAGNALGTLVAVNDRIRTRASRGEGQSVLLVYYSGHADRQSLHLGDSRFRLTQLEQLVRGSAADFRLLIVDACHSGALTRVKGGRSAPPLSIAVDERLAGEGVVFLTSSASGEDAQESDELKGSFFTHYLVSGLLGAADTNRDGVVVLKEAYRHAYDNTIRASSLTRAGIQHPTFRYELGGRGDVVLSRLAVAARDRAVVRLPTGRDYLLLRGGRDGPVVAEVGARDAGRAISLRAGSYFVRARGADHLLEGRVELRAGAVTAVDDAGLDRIDYARLVRKGTPLRASVHGPVAGYQVRSPIARGASPCHGPVTGWATDRPSVRLAARLAICRGSFRNDVLEATTDELDVGVRVSRAWDLPLLSLDVGAGAGGSVLLQRFETSGRAPRRWGGAGYLDVGGAATRYLWRGTYAALEAGARAYAVRVDGAERRQLELRPAARVGLAIGVQF